MTAFTVGYTAAYDRLLRDGYTPEQGMGIDTPPTKLGRSDDVHRDGTNVPYAGGIVFPSVDDAWRWLGALSKRDQWSVYEIDADYETDCYQQNAGDLYRHLSHDVRILGKMSTVNEPDGE